VTNLIFEIAARRGQQLSRRDYRLRACATNANGESTGVDGGANVGSGL
jgi:hypothetical protein